MLNKEKFAKEIIEIATNGNFTHGNFKEIAVVDGKPCRCENTNCRDCDFNIITCDNELSEWANSEYKELVIDWDKVPVDTPVLVWDYDVRKKDIMLEQMAQNSCPLLVEQRAGLLILVKI